MHQTEALVVQRRLQDLGQFERFRRMMHSKDYFILLGHTEHKFLSCLQVGKCVSQIYLVMSMDSRETGLRPGLAMHIGGR